MAKPLLERQLQHAASPYQGNPAQRATTVVTTRKASHSVGSLMVAKLP